MELSRPHSTNTVAKTSSHLDANENKITEELSNLPVKTCNLHQVRGHT